MTLPTHIPKMRKSDSSGSRAKKSVALWRQPSVPVKGVNTALGESPYLAAIAAKRGLTVSPKWGTFAMVDVNEIRSDIYQRPINTMRVRKYAADFKFSLFGAVVLGRRSEGDLYVIDGQHRLEAAKLIGFQHVPCIVYSGTTQALEAKTFAALQNERMGLKKHETLNARVLAGDKVATEIVAIAASHGFKIQENHEGPGPYKLRSAGTVETIYDYDGGTCLEFVFSVMKDAFDGTEPAMRADIMRGLAQFYACHGNDPRVRYHTVVANFKRQGVADTLNRASLISKGGGYPSTYATYMAFVHAFNYKRTPEQRIDPGQPMKLVSSHVKTAKARVQADA